MKNSTLKYILFASVILNISFLGTAGYQYYKQSTYWTSPFGYKVQKGHFLFEELSLRPEQLKSMRENAAKFRTIIDGRREEVAAKRKELMALLREDNPDKKAIETEVFSISGMQEQMQALIAAHVVDMKSKLDKDQQKKFLDLIENAMMEGRQVGWPPMQQN